MMMDKRLLNVLLMFFMFGLTACQTTTQPGFFHPFIQHTTPTQAVQDALASTGDPEIMKVHVEPAHDGVILSGYVKKIRQSDTALQLARQTPGVHAVENHIVVKP
jgi:hyperosmotically inducible periplasmic protein